LRFILVDEILELTPGREIVAQRRIAPDEEYFQDHFPGFPVVPGVLLTEMMAQAAGKCLYAENRARGIPMLAKITSASFRDWARPGQLAILRGRVRSSRPEFATVDCRVDIEGRPIADAQLLFTFLPREQFGGRYEDAVLDRFLHREDVKYSGRRGGASDHGCST